MVRTLPYLTQLRNLQVLTLEEPESLFDVQALSCIQTLSKLTISGTYEGRGHLDLMPIKRLTALVTLEVVAASAYQNLEHLGIQRLKLCGSSPKSSLRELPL